MHISRKAEDIKPFLVMDILEAAHDLPNEMGVIHLEVGEPDFDTPLCVRTAAIKAMEEGKTHYTHSLAIPELREAICAHYKRTYGVDVDPSQVLVTTGSSAALLIAFAVLLDAGDSIIMTDPRYACYPNFARVLDAVIDYVPTRNDGFRLDPDRVRAAIHHNTRAILINSPSNPTGVCLDRDRMAALAESGITIISDEIYHGLVYEGEQHTMREFTDDAIIINGFSKAWAMTGWRLGWAIFPKRLIRAAQKLQQNLVICAPSFAQWAGVAALEKAGPDCEAMKEVFAKRRIVMLSEMEKYGFRVESRPTGAFYVMANIDHITDDSYRLAFDILKNTGVGVTPGIDFGHEVKSFIRFSYANSEANIIEGIRRVGLYLKGL
ncbi:MAG TPA: pyridoxal phosphate-dependent aminotransferase [Desulfomonilia bacterium]